MDPELAAILSYVPMMIAGVVAIVGVSVFGWVHTTRMKIRHGYPLENMWGMPIHPKHDGETQERVRLATQENAALRAELASVKDRLAVVERIVTDKGFDVARQIEALQDQREKDMGVPLEIDRDKTVN